jgi:hypothetical protein
MPTISIFPTNAMELYILTNHVIHTSQCKDKIQYSKNRIEISEDVWTHKDTHFLPNKKKPFRLLKNNFY